jgi:hypothetical protein
MFKTPAWASFIDVNLANGVASAVSQARLTRYGLRLDEPGGTRIEAVAKHGMNITLCEALYPALHMLEIVMRNAIHNTFSLNYECDGWYEIAGLRQNHVELIEIAKKKIQKRGKQANPDRVVAELTFGFWCGMFHRDYESGAGPWPHLLSAVAPRVPKRWRTRDKIQRRIEEARFLRNRVFHHECITCLPDLRDRHRKLVELVGWLSPEARTHLEHLCRFKTVISDSLSV